jgi:hypothetical protein
MTRPYLQRAIAIAAWPRRSEYDSATALHFISATVSTELPILQNPQRPRQ